MKHNRQALLLALILTLFFSAADTVILAQTSDGFHLEWHVIGNGGGSSSSADYRVSSGYWLRAAPTQISTSTPTATATATGAPNSTPTQTPTATTIATLTPDAAQEIYLPIITQ